MGGGGVTVIDRADARHLSRECDPHYLPGALRSLQRLPDGPVSRLLDLTEVLLHPSRARVSKLYLFERRADDVPALVDDCDLCAQRSEIATHEESHEITFCMTGCSRYVGRHPRL